MTTRWKLESIKKAHKENPCELFNFNDLIIYMQFRNKRICIPFFLYQQV